MKHVPGGKKVKCLHQLVLKETHYKPANLDEIVSYHDDLSPLQKEELLALLKKHEDLLQGRWVHWTGDSISLEVEEGAKPYYG